MKTNKASAAFLTKFSPFLSKFKQSSTINVAHEQIRKIFSQFKFSQIAIAFASKMDTCDQLSQKQKKQYVKIYISLIDVYGQDIILEHYDRIIDSIAKKTTGVYEVIGHLCKTLLKRIYPTQNIANYIQHLLLVFQKHVQFGKIIKQIVQSFDSQIIRPFQQQIMSLIGQKMSSNQKNQAKTQYLQAILAVILALQSKFYEETTVQNIISKNFKNQDWNIRKLCVDISYALFVINNETNKVLHQNVMELKYDKIKHVRDSVGNYTNLYKQIYGEQVQKQKQRPSISDKNKNTKSTNQIKRTTVSKSPAIPIKFKPNQSESKSNPKSLQKSLKNIQRNQQFFQNAGSQDVIKIPENKSFVSISKHPNQLFNLSDHKQRRRQHQNVYIENRLGSKQNLTSQRQRQKNEVNFEQYLKNRPKPDNFMNLSSSPKSPKHNKFKNEPLTKLAQSSLVQDQNQDDKNYDANNLIRKQLKLVQLKLQKFTLQTNNKLISLQRRVENLQSRKNQQNSVIDQLSLTSLQKDIKQIRNQINPNNNYEQSFQQKYKQVGKFNRKQKNYDDQRNINPNFNTFSNHAQSNLNQKIKQSVKNSNWDQAFSLAIANGSRSFLFQLLKSNQIPKDKLVQDCLFIQLRKKLSSLVVLKWLSNYIQNVDVSNEKLKKLYFQLEKAQYVIEQGSEINSFENDARNYKMLKTIILRQIKQRLQGYLQLSNSHNQSIVSDLNYKF